MKHIKMQILDGGWLPEETEGEMMENIGLFLKDVGWNSAHDFIQWLMDIKVSTMQSNGVLLIRDKDEIIIGDKYATDFYFYASRVPIAALIDLLQQWKKLCLNRVQDLMGASIAYDGTKFYLEPIFH